MLKLILNPNLIMNISVLIRTCKKCGEICRTEGGYVGHMRICGSSELCTKCNRRGHLENKCPYKSYITNGRLRFNFAPVPPPPPEMIVSEAVDIAKYQL